jgi:hypothetical protein
MFWESGERFLANGYVVPCQIAILGAGRSFRDFLFADFYLVAFGFGERDDLLDVNE